MTQRENYLAEGFRDVDRQNGIEKCKNCLTFIDSLPSFRRYKEETDRLLRPSDGRAFADIGCGLGFDVERLARKTPGKAFGLDASKRFIFEARKRAQALGLANVDYVIGDARTMSFEDEAFDGVRADRVLQHVENPERVVKEMARVVRKGGRVVCAEPDWGSFFIEDGDAGCVEAVSREWTGSIRNRFIGRRLPGLLQSAGL